MKGFLFPLSQLRRIFQFGKFRYQSEGNPSGNNKPLFHFWQARYQPSWQPQKSFISLLLINSTIVAVGATALISYGIVRSLIVESLKSNALLQVQNAGDESDQWLSNLLAQVELMANTPQVRSLDWSVAEPYLQLELDRLPDFTAFQMAKPDGSYYITTVGFAKGKNMSDRPFFVQAMAGEANIDDPVIGRNSGIWNAHVTAPIWSVPRFRRSQLTKEQAVVRGRSLGFFNHARDPYQKVKPIGVLSSSIPVVHLSEIVAKISSGEGSYAFALDSKGQVLAHPNKHLVEKPNSFLTVADPALARISHAMVKRQRGIELVQMEGKWVYVAYLPLQKANWSLALVIPRANLERQLLPLNLLASVLGVLLVIATLVALRQTRLFEQTRARADQEALLNRLTGRIRESLNLDTILQTTVNEVGSLLDLQRVNFSWYQPQERSLEIVCEYRREDLPEQLGIFHIDNFGDLGDRLSQTEAVRLNDVANDPSLTKPVRHTYWQIGAYSYLALPVLVKDSPPACLICVRAKPKSWNRHEIELLDTVASQLAIAINQSRLYAKTEEQVQIVSEQAQQLKAALNELQNTQAQLIQTEKISSLGNLVAGVAHEINNPVNFIYGNLDHTSEYTKDLLHLMNLYQKHYPQPVPEILDAAESIDLEFLVEDLPKIVASMKIGAERIRQIVLSLRNFSRLDEAQMKPVDIHEGIESTLLILQNRLKATNEHPGIQLIKEYGNLPQVECYAGQLNQVFMNILSNAIDALKELLFKRLNVEGSEELKVERLKVERSNQSSKEQPANLQPATPKIWIRTEVIDRNRVVIKIKDNGPGMTKEVHSRLFDPFFTTKPVGQGTGLGLAISYQIVVEKHGGVLKCFSEPGQGAEFCVEIPIGQTQKK